VNPPELSLDRRIETGMPGKIECIVFHVISLVST
jgi:hypothetical protein